VCSETLQVTTLVETGIDRHNVVGIEIRGSCGRNPPLELPTTEIDPDRQVEISDLAFASQ
jgi:hypothetical protein